jgi:hypothetical protein
MQTRLLLNRSFLLLAGMFFLSSCKKNLLIAEIDQNTDRVMVEFTESKNTSNAISIPFASGWVDIDLTELRLNTRSKLNKAVTVKFVVNPTIVADYNTLNGTDFKMLPGGSYSFESNQLTLTPSERGKTIRMKIKPSSITGGAFAIGLSIAETSEGEISPTSSNVFIVLQVKNAYEGDYKATGQRILYNGPVTTSGVAAIAPIDRVKFASTIDNNTIEIEVADLAGAYMYLQVNSTNNQVLVLPSSTNPTFSPMNNNGSCMYDPASRTFTLNYLYFNASGALREIKETLVAL